MKHSFHYKLGKLQLEKGEYLFVNNKFYWLTHEWMSLILLTHNYFVKLKTA